MSRMQAIAQMTLAVTGMGLCAYGNAGGETPVAGDALVVRMVHPDRQALEALKSFAGARVAHPAAALAAWKRSAREPNLLGKPVEAVISMFNPEMAAEWKVLHDAEVRIDVGAADGSARWYAIVPRDDGTVSAAVTAMRMTDGTTENPIRLAGKEFGVERLGPAGAVVSARIGEVLIIGSSRDDLARGLQSLVGKPPLPPADAAHFEVRRGSTVPRLETKVDSGLVFDFDPGRLSAGVGTTTYRRAVALLQGLGSRRINGDLALNDDQLALDVTTLLTNPVPPSSSTAAIDRAWLTWVPARDAMGAVSIAFESGAAFWDRAFALADRVERADPARGEVAPIRTRFNLLAAAAGVRPEVDLWPHLKGVTASVIADPSQPGRPGGALVVLHMDAEASAGRLAMDVLPRLTALFTGKKWSGNKPGGDPVPKPAPAKPTGPAPEQNASQLGTAGGRSLVVYRRGRDAVIAWGDAALSASVEAAGKPDRSIAALCTDWARIGKGPPQRLGVIWPARCWPPIRGVDTTSPAWRVLAQDPPAVWWGWTGADEAHDSIHFAALRQRVHQFLDQLPLDPSPLR
jgi:hypothetical protein